MRVGVGDAGDIIDWFITNSRAEWLGRFLAGDQKSNQLLNEVRALFRLYMSGLEQILFIPARIRTR
jgi:hypothetical protein